MASRCDNRVAAGHAAPYESPEERVQFFEQDRGGLLAKPAADHADHGASPTLSRLSTDAWDRFRHAGYWWMHAMVLVWVVFTLMLFVLEPFGCTAGSGSPHAETGTNVCPD